ncbi:MAG TPA: winged helix-turn-helix transcriptional regulator [Plantibacter sp.]|uniref:winged helix-turn-helix transcriptional regulator n=1 Tax=unclassified Plantibacter TaxID=2624265 RepID=UPI002CA5BF23|nr:winged helix-turn-helix transcriptional regulator [Plantibacter sp.]
MNEWEQPALPGLPPVEELSTGDTRPRVASRAARDPAALDPRVRRALATLDEDPDLSLVTLANALGITRATLIRIVREAIGMSPKDYAATVRSRPPS